MRTPLKPSTECKQYTLSYTHQIPFQIRVYRPNRCKQAPLDQRHVSN